MGSLYRDSMLAHKQLSKLVNEYKICIYMRSVEMELCVRREAQGHIASASSLWDRANLFGDIYYILVVYTCFIDTLMLLMGLRLMRIALPPHPLHIVPYCMLCRIAVIASRKTLFTGWRTFIMNIFTVTCRIIIYLSLNFIDYEYFLYYFLSDKYKFKFIWTSHSIIVNDFDLW